MRGLQRLPHNEETVILSLVRQNSLPISAMRCDYTRQQDSGAYNSRYFGQCGISYSLMLCKWCGNLEGTRNNTPHCPYKLNALKERMSAA